MDSTANLQINLKEVERDLDNLAKRQLPFAIAKALTDTAKDAQRALEAQLPKKLDMPTPFTKRAFTTRMATKRKPVATVIVKDIQANYLKYVIEGGTEMPGNKKIVQPANIKLNRYGNVPSMRGGRKIASLLAKPNTFQGTVHGVSGVWQRTNKNKKLKLLLRFVTKQTYQKRFPFYQIVEGVARNRLRRNFDAALQSAIKTAR